MFTFGPASRGGALSLGQFNPADKAASVVLLNGNTTARGDGTAGSVRGLTSKSAGTLYFEITGDAGYIGGNIAGIYGGVCDSAMSLTAQPIFGSPGGKWVAARANTQYGNDASGYIGTFSGSGWTSSGVVYTLGFVCNFATRAVDIYLDGVLKVSALTWSAGGGAMFPFANVQDPNGNGNATLRTVSGTFLQSIPGGAQPWDN